LAKVGARPVRDESYSEAVGETMLKSLALLIASAAEATAGRACARDGEGGGR
jgi:hypothetical protein